MINGKRIAALVPMRHHSVRVIGKNYRCLAGKPLFHHILTTLMDCPEIDEIVVDTDSPAIMAGVRQNFPDITLIERAAALSADTIPMNEILLVDTAQVKADLYLQTHSTNPLLTSSTLSAAIRSLVEQMPAYDSLFGVTRLQTRLWDALARPINHNPSILLRTQDLPPIYEENSCMYLFSRETLVSKRNRIGDRPLLFEIKREEAFDIDEELDFLMADLMLQHQQKSDLV